RGATLGRPRAARPNHAGASGGRSRISVLRRRQVGAVADPADRERSQPQRQAKPGMVKPSLSGGWVAALPLLAACANYATGTARVDPSAQDCRFANPVTAGADPWVVRRDSSYYFVQSQDRTIWVYRSDRLTEPTKNGVPVWTAPHNGSNRSNVWAPELHYIDGRWYTYSAAATPQHLYIARMCDPWTISSDRVRISSPTESWERGTELDLNEGPEFLERGADVFIIYSTRESWLKDYRLGQLKLTSLDADPMDPGNWTKSGPVFTGTATVYGVGHASF